MSIITLMHLLFPHPIVTFNDADNKEDPALLEWLQGCKVDERVIQKVCCLNPYGRVFTCLQNDSSPSSLSLSSCHSRMCWNI